jgi:tRNA uracil 4-sulfurtransferase
MDAVIVRYGELALKGKNRNLFEKRLITNIKDYISANKSANIDLSSNIYMSSNINVSSVRGRIFIEGIPDNIKELKNVFGITSFSPAKIFSQEFSEIKKELTPFLDKIAGKKFRVSVNRADKNLSFNSVDYERMIGGFIGERTGAKVDLKNFDINFCFEFISGKCYFYYESFSGFGGLPVGSQDHLCCYIEDEFGAFAALLLLRRGCTISIFYKKDYDISIFQRYSYGFRINSTAVNSFEDSLSYLNGLPISIGSIDTEDYIKSDRYVNLKEDVMVLNPIVGFNEQEAKDKLRVFL